MEKRHSDTLTDRFEEVINRGTSHILWSELYSWYDTTKITNKLYRDLIRRWDELIEGYEATYGGLKRIEGAGGIFLIATETIKEMSTTED